jgi:hypothetical protein
VQRCKTRFLFFKSLLLAVTAGLSFVCLVPVTAFGVGQEFIPLENWSYKAVERFESLGMCNLPEDAPYTRTEFIKIVNQIVESTFDRRLTARDQFEMSRLEQEYTEYNSQRDPQARWDPPTFFLQERPMILELDLDLAGIAARPYLDEFGTEYFLNSNPSVRLHFSDHVTYDVRYRLTLGPENGDRARGEKPSRRERSFKGLTSMYERSYIMFGWDRAHVFYGREYIDWGPSDWVGLITPWRAISIDQLGWRAKLKWFRISMFHGTLSPELRRNIAGHRLEMLFGRVTIGLNETVVYAGKDWDPIYFFPLSSFYANQYNERGNDDNILWSGDVKVSFLDALTLYTGGLVDDFQFERDGNHPDKYAIEFGGRLALSNPVATTWRFRYQRVDIYTYTHHDTLAYYLSGEADPELDGLLGGQPGPDADTWRIEGEFYPYPTVVLTAGVFSQRLGEGNDLRPYEPGDPIDPPFPSGVVQKTLGWDLKARWELPRNSWIEGYYSSASLSNLSHQSGRDETTDAFRLVVRVDF